MIHTSDILPGISLTCVETDKFKTGCVSINLITRLDKSTASASALLPRVLRRGSKEHPDMESLSSALDDIYGANVEPIVRKKGELHCIGLYADFPDSRYIPGDDDLLEKTLDIARGILTTPATDDGLLHGDYVSGEKKNLIDDIRAAINDKRGYAVDRLLEEMCSGEAYGVSKLGSETEADAITPASLTKYYRSIIDNAAIKVFYCGCEKPQRVESILRSAFAKLPPRSGAKLPTANIILHPKDAEPRRFTESLDVTQGKLSIGFRLGNVMENPNYALLSVFNAVYGGSVSSKLFLNVREKLSLCYYASSSIDKHKGIMLVSSGVEFDKFDAATDEILLQLKNIKDGDITPDELLSAKRAVVTGIKSAMDRPSGLEDYYFDSSIAAVGYDPAELCDKVEAVTIDDIVKTASDIQIDMIYTLKD